MLSPTARSSRARLAALERWRPPDDPELVAARRELQADRLADRIHETADDLTEDRRAALLLLLARGGS